MGTNTQVRAYKRSWKNLLINARYQLRFTLFMVLVCAVLMTFLGFWVMKRAHRATEVSIANVQGNPDVFPEPDKEIHHLRSRENLVGWILGGTGLLICVGLFVYGIKMTHKVAGPLFKVTSYFDKVKAGKYDTVYNLRKGDQLIEFYEHFKECHAALKKKEVDDVERLREVVKAADAENLGSKSPELAAKLDELKALLKQKEVSLG
jgi:hypothetical protein